MKVAAIVLAAGASRRLGEPKQLVSLGGETLLERTVRICTETSCDPTIVVLGANADLIVSKSPPLNASVIVNLRWEEGMASTIRAGISALPDDVAGCVLLTCDMPFVTSEHLRKLSSSAQTTASSYSGRQGVPAFFPHSMFEALLHLRGNSGARELLRNAPSIELANGNLDVDTVEDIERARAILSPS